MKSKFTSFIMIIIIILILGVIGIFGMMIFGEIKSIETDIIPEDFKTIISDTKNTVDKNVCWPPKLKRKEKNKFWRGSREVGMLGHCW